jgi:carbonic anhydrase
MLVIQQIESIEQVSAAQALMAQYFSWFFALLPGAQQDPTFRGWEQELAELPGPYAAPAGRFLLATWNGQAAGCVALKPVDKLQCELKRLFVLPDFRGHRIGEQLVAAFLSHARLCGYRLAVLDSHITMDKAHAIYRGLGFQTLAAPIDFPQELKQSVIFMSCEI